MGRHVFVAVILAGVILIMSGMTEVTVHADTENQKDNKVGLLTDPVLMNPEDSSVSVVWFTEEEGIDNVVILFENGKNLPSTRSIKAETKLMSRLRGGKSKEDCNDPTIQTPIYRHEAVVSGLPKYHGASKERVSYCVKSDNFRSGIFSLAAKAQPGTPMKILLTSDMQSKPMCAANYTKVYETVGYVDAVLANGDVVDVIDRAYDWFYADNAFFKILQGRGEDSALGTLYKGAPFLQNAPVYVSLGNHDYMGRYNNTDTLDAQFNNPAPDDFNRITWEEIFTMPDEWGSENYYMTSMGDLGLITLDVNRPWRLSEVGIRGRYSELLDSTVDILGHGEFIFEPVSPGSRQYEFFEKSLASDTFTKAKYKMVMFHSPYSTLGRNGVHAFTDPVKKTVTDSLTGKSMDIFMYPRKDDQIEKYLVPMMEKSGVNILFEGHTHIWNRFKTDKGLNVLETSNVGNSYGGFYDEKNSGDIKPFDENTRPDIPSVFMPESERSNMREYWDINDFAIMGDLYGNEPEYPSQCALPDNKPYLASETITAFSVLDTGSGTIDSYYFDTSNPESTVVKFDSFSL